MVLRSGYIVLAGKLQEAAISDSNKQSRLSDALRDIYRGTGTWAYLVDVFGDDKSGDVIYSCDSDLKKAPYTFAGDKVTIDTAAAKDVYPLTTYHDEAVDATEAGRRNSTRDLKQLQSIHDASASLGAECAMKESGHAKPGLKLVESAAFKTDLTIREALTPGRAIKLISPGKGSSAWYTTEALKKSVANNIFKAGTPMRIDHPTAAEESARPEGSVRDWGAVLAKDAFWLDNHAEGPGLYSEVKTFSDHAKTIEEKGPYAGISIRANGTAVMEAGRPVMRDGVPVLKEFTSAEGVDMVTRAGAGGLFLTEAARSATQQENSMDEAAVQKLIEAAIKPQTDRIVVLTTQNATLLERALRGDAIVEAGRLLKESALPEPLRELVVATVLREGAAIPQKDGVLDTAKLKESLDAEAKRVGAAFSTATGGGRVFGMGAAPVVPIDAKETERRQQAAKDDHEQNVRVFESLMGGNKAAAEFAAKGRVA